MLEAVEVKPIEVTDPYPGLRPFEPDEAEIFFGRDAHVNRLLEILQREHFLAVIGPSGCGKSSLVRAGLLPAVSAGWLGTGSDWRIVIMRPGDRPLRALAAGLVDSTALGPELKSAGAEERAAIRVEADLVRGPRGLIDVFRAASASGASGKRLNLLILVDQFEELFTYAKGGDVQADESAAFVDLLLEAKDEKSLGIYVVLTMRTDFLGHCVRFLELPDAINRAQYLTPRLNRDEMKDAIVSPARLFNRRVTEQLVGQLINSVGAESDQLPVLQHALSRIWETLGSSSKLTEDHLRDVGGVAEALSKHATDLYEKKLSSEQQKLAEHLFRFITERTSPEDGSRDVRRPRSLSEIAEAMEGTEWTAFVPIVDVYAAKGVNFLTYSGRLDADTKIDISHEALIRKWEMLKTWVTDEAKRAADYREWRERALANKRGEAGLLTVELARADRWLRGEKWKPTARWAKRYTSDGHEVEVEFGEAERFIDRSREDEKDKENKRREEENAKQQTELKRRQAEERGRLAEEGRRLAEEKAKQLEEKTRLAEEKNKLIEEQNRLADERNQRNRRFFTILAILVIVLLGSLVGTLRQWRRAEAATKRAKTSADEALKSADDARKSEAFAIKAAERASRAEEQSRVEAGKARDAEKEEKKARDLAEKAAIEATEQADIATALRKRAEVLRMGSDLNAELARTEANRANDQAKRASDATRVASARLLIRDSEKYDKSDSDRAQLLAIEAYKASHDTRALTEAMSRLRAIRLGFAEQLVAYRGHSKGVIDAEFSPDGQTIVTGASDGTARLWVAESGVSTTPPMAAASEFDEVTGASFSPDGTMVLTLGDVTQLWDAHGKLIRPFNSSTVAGDTDTPLQGGFSPNGRRIAVVIVGGLVRVWETATGNLVATLGRPGAAESEKIEHVAFAPDGSRLVTVESSGLVKVWDATNGHELMRFNDAVSKDKDESETLEEMLSSEMANVEFSFDGKFIVATHGQEASVWNVSTKKRIAKVKHDAVISKAHFSPDAKTFVTVGADGFAVICATENGTPKARLAHNNVAVRDADFNDDGTLLVTVSDDGNGRVWDLRQLDLASMAPISTLKGHRNPVVSVRFSPNGRMIVTAGEDGTARLWRTRTERSTRVSTVSMSQATWSPDGAVFAVGRDGMGRLIRSGSQTAVFDQKPRAAAAAISPDGAVVATAGTDGMARLWNVKNASPPRDIRWHEEEPSSLTQLTDPNGSRDPKKPESVTPYVVFSPDSTMLLTTGDSTPRLWKVSDGTLIRPFEKNDVRVLSAVYSPDGRLVAAVDLNGKAHVYLVGTGDEIGSFGEEKQAVSKLVFSPDSSVILSTGRSDGTARLWTPEGDEVRLFGHGANVQHAAFSPDGRLVVTAGIDGEVRVWDASRNREVATLTGHRGPVRFASFSPDGKTIATAGDDRTARLWETSSGLLLDTLTNGNFNIGVGARAIFAPNDGTQLLTVGSDGSTRIWDVSAVSQGADEMIKAIQRRVGRPLTEAERAESHIDAEPAAAPSGM